MADVPVVPYEMPEPWVPSGGFEPFRPPEVQRKDAEEAARREAAEEQEEREESE